MIKMDKEDGRDVAGTGKFTILDNLLRDNFKVKHD